MAQLSGNVIDPAGKPIENATIAIPSDALFALSDENGLFEIDGISLGTQRVNVVHRTHKKFSEDITIYKNTDVSLIMDNL